MKPTIIPRPFAACGFAALLLTPAFAIEAPSDNAPPPAEKAEAAQAEAAPAGKKDAKKAFLGIMTTGVPEMITEHLGLKPGEGVAVRNVSPNSPAAGAGILANDIITRIDGKEISSHEDIIQLIAEHKPGDKIRVETIQKGKNKPIEIALGERPDMLGAIEADPMQDNLPLDGIPKEMADRIRGAIKGNIGGIQLKLDHLGEGGIQDEQLKELNKQLEKMGNMKGFQGMMKFEGGAAQSSVRMNDGKGTVEMKTTKDGKEVTVKDPQDKVLWSGPWDTDQDKAAAPAEIRERIDALNLGNFGNNGGMLKIGPNLRFGGAGEPDENAEKKEPEKPE